MTDSEVEVSLQQLRNCRENEATYRRLAEQIERRLAEAGITYKATMVGTAWQRATGQEGADADLR